MKGVESTFGGKPIALYDADKQLCFAIFENAATCGKYVFPKLNRAVSTSKVHSCLYYKSCSKPKSNHIGVRLAFRLATEEQIKFLKNDFAILLAEEYPEIKFNVGLSFDSTAAQLTKKWREKMDKRFIEQNRIKALQTQQYSGN